MPEETNLAEKALGTTIAIGASALVGGAIYLADPFGSTLETATAVAESATETAKAVVDIPGWTDRVGDMLAGRGHGLDAVALGIATATGATRVNPLWAAVASYTLPVARLIAHMRTNPEVTEAVAEPITHAQAGGLFTIMLAAVPAAYIAGRVALSGPVSRLASYVMKK